MASPALSAANAAVLERVLSADVAAAQEADARTHVYMTCRQHLLRERFAQQQQRERPDVVSDVGAVRGVYAVLREQIHAAAATRAAADVEREAEKQEREREREQRAVVAAPGTDVHAATTSNGDAAAAAAATVAEGASVVTAVPARTPAIPAPPEVEVHLAPLKKKSAASDAHGGGGGARPAAATEAYAFTGIHHMFAEAHAPVSRVMFGHDDRNLLCYACDDGTLCVCSAHDNPRLLYTLSGHADIVSDFDISAMNDVLVSVSLDRSVRVWSVADGQCLATIDAGVPLLSVTFHPLNNNTFYVGTATGRILAYNMSTRKQLASQSCGRRAGGVLDMVFDARGARLFAGDSKGTLHTFTADVRTARLTALARTQVSPTRSSITSLAYRAHVSARERKPTLLVSCNDNTLRLYHVSANKGELHVWKTLRVASDGLPVRSCFCPLVSAGGTAAGAMCVVSGCADGCVHIYDILRAQRPCINRLQGHSAAVFAVAWSYDESLLASADASGMVFLWKRETMAADRAVLEAPAASARRRESEWG